MMRFIAAILSAALLATAAHAQSGLLPANQVWAGPPSGGQGYARSRALVNADLPALSVALFALASGQIVVGQVSGFASAVAMSGDCTIVASGAVTCTKLNGTTPGTGVLAALGTAVGSAGAVVVNGGALGTPSSGVGTNLTGLNASNLASGTLPAARLPLTNTSFSVATASTAGTTSASPLMAGAGVTNCKITPTYSGRVSVRFDIAHSNPGGASFGTAYALRFGTGTAPASNAAAAGTVVSGPFTYTSDAGNTRQIALSAVITGLTPGTAYWFDFSQSSNGAISISAVYGCNGFEF